MANENSPVVNIKITNHLTGEITEVEVKSPETAKNLILELNASMSGMRNAQDRLKNYLDDFLGQDDEYKFIDGKIVRRVQRSSAQYRVEDLRKYLDQDQLDVCLKVDMPAANQLIAEMVERGELPPDTLKQIRKTADIKATRPYIEVR